MSGKKTSVYLTEEILEQLDKRGLTVMQAIRRGIEMTGESAERQLLKSMARTLIEIRDNTRPEAQLRREVTSISLPLDAYAQRAICAQCMHPHHEGACKTECETCIEDAAYAIRQQQRAGVIGGYSRNTGGPQPLILPSGIENCTAECDHTVGKHVPAKAGDVKCTDCGHPLANHDEIGHWGCTVRGCSCTLRRSQAAQSETPKIAAPDPTGVHAAHCCQIHGCKYGASLDCPVYEGSVTQLYACPQCTETDEMETPNG